MNTYIQLNIVADKFKSTINNNYKCAVIYDAVFMKYILYHNILEYFNDDAIKNQIVDILFMELDNYGLTDYLLGYDPEFVDKLDIKQNITTNNIKSEFSYKQTEMKYFANENNISNISNIGDVKEKYAKNTNSYKYRYVA